jgi:hypothetical protein
MQRRQCEAIREFNRQSSRQANVMIWLTWAIAGLTFVLRIIAGIQIWLMVNANG